MATFRILLAILKGELFQHVDPSEYLTPLLRSLNGNLGVLDVLSTKLYTENVDLILKSLEFINKYFSLNHYQLYSLNYLIEYFLKLQKSDYFIILNNILQDQRFKQILYPSVKKLNESVLRILNTLNEIKVDSNNILQLDMIEETAEFSLGSEKKKDQNYIINNYSVLQLIDFYFFSQNSNITFKKSYHEQILFNNNKERFFPLIPVSQKITTLLLAIFQNDINAGAYVKLKQYFFLRDLLHFNIISKFLEIWKESGAEQDELENLTLLVQILLKHIDSEMDDELHVVDQILSIFKNTSYSKLREIQLNNYKQENLSLAANEITSFDKILKDQVFEFIKNQRFLQLSKGAWVFADLPSFNTTEDAPSTNYFFIILSPNFKNLLFKEYKFKTQNIPDIDKIGTPIEINSIATFKIEEIQQVDPTAARETESSRLINLVGKTLINKITLVNRKGKVLFTFYAKKHDSFNYLDGLNLLLGNYDSLSKDLTFQIDKLFEIRKTIQLLNYTSGVDMNGVNEEQIYDLDNLEKLTTNFYYS